MLRWDKRSHGRSGRVPGAAAGGVCPAARDAAPSMQKQYLTTKRRASHQLPAFVVWFRHVLDTGISSSRGHRREENRRRRDANGRFSAATGVRPTAGAVSSPRRRGERNPPTPLGADGVLLLIWLTSARSPYGFDPARRPSDPKQKDGGDMRVSRAAGCGTEGGFRASAHWTSPTGYARTAQPPRG